MRQLLPILLPMLLALLAAPVLAQSMTISGRPIPGGLLIIGIPPGDGGLKLDGIPIPAAEPGRFLVGIPRDAVGTMTLKSFGGLETKVVLEPRSYRIQRLPALGVTDAPAPQWVQRREREVAVMRSGKWSAAAAPAASVGWKQAFAIPAVGRETGVYGSQRVYGGLPRSPHTGLDIAARIGTPVKAPAAGIVRVATGPFLLEGNVVLLDHGAGLVTSYLHLDSISVRPGDKVARGAVIGSIGNTGRSTGPHLHWGMSLVRPAPGGGFDEVRLDPKLMLK